MFLDRLIFLFLFCGILFACLEVPDSPVLSMESPPLSACLIQNSSPCKTTLQASPNDSFSVIAKISPAYLEDSLHFSWKANGKILASNAQFKTDTSRVPDTLVAQDSYGNSLSFPLSFVFDTAPQISTKTIPANGDTLRGNATTAFLFAYSATDPDQNDSLFFTLELDSARFSVGTLTRIYQSGFSAGSHTFRVFVQDGYGLRDSSETIRFFVVEEK